MFRFLLALVLAALPGAADIFPPLIARPCGGTACTTGTYDRPTSGQIAGIVAVYDSLYAENPNNPPNPDFTISDAFTNATGYVIGEVRLSSNPTWDGTFAYYNGQILWSTDNELIPVDLNDNNLAVFSGCSGLVSACLYGLPSPSPDPLTFVDPIIEQIYFTSNTDIQFFGIDDNDDIVGEIQSTGQEYIFSPVPEPSSVLLLSAALLAVGFAARKRIARGL